MRKIIYIILTISLPLISFNEFKQIINSIPCGVQPKFNKLFNEENQNGEYIIYNLKD